MLTSELFRPAWLPRRLYRISPLSSEKRLRAEMDKAFRAALILSPDDDIASLSNSLASGSVLRSWGHRANAQGVAFV